MKKLALLISAFAATSVLATETTYYGIDGDRQECFLTMDGEDSFTLKAQDYTFANIILQAPQSGARFFEEVTMDYGDNVYSRVIGSPITIGKVGLLEVTGKVVYDGQGRPSAIDLSAKGGLLNWYRNTFVCTELK